MVNIIDKLGNVSGSTMDSLRIMELLDITSDEFLDPNRFQKFQEVIKKLSEYPNKEFMIKKVTLKKMGHDKLNIIWEYLKALELKKMHEDELAKITESKDVIVKFSEEKGLDPEELEEYQKHLEQIDSISSSLKELEDEIGLYEN